MAEDPLQALLDAHVFTHQVDTTQTNRFEMLAKAEAQLEPKMTPWWGKLSQADFLTAWKVFSDAFGAALYEMLFLPGGRSVNDVYQILFSSEIGPYIIVPLLALCVLGEIMSLGLVATTGS